MVCTQLPEISKPFGSLPSNYYCFGKLSFENNSQIINPNRRGKPLWLPYFQINNPNRMVNPLAVALFFALYDPNPMVNPIAVAHFLNYIISTVGANPCGCPFKITKSQSHGQSPCGCPLFQILSFNGQKKLYE